MIRVGIALGGVAVVAGLTLVGGIIGVAYLAEAIGVFALLLMPLVLGVVLVVVFWWMEIMDDWV